MLFLESDNKYWIDFLYYDRASYTLFGRMGSFKIVEESPACTSIYSNSLILSLQSLIEVNILLIWVIDWGCIELI